MHVWAKAPTFMLYFIENYNKILHNLSYMVKFAEIVEIQARYLFQCMSSASWWWENLQKLENLLEPLIFCYKKSVLACKSPKNSLSCTIEMPKKFLEALEQGSSHCCTVPEQQFWNFKSALIPVERDHVLLRCPRSSSKL